jgi:molecular chaperone GrpE
MGLAAARGQGAEAGAVADGIDLTLKQMAAVMERHGITPVDPQGETFNPELHQAMTAQESAECAPNTVLQVLQKGYRLHDRLLRPAMVVVSKAPAGTPSGEIPPPGA